MFLLGKDEPFQVLNFVGEKINQVLEIPDFTGNSDLG